MATPKFGRNYILNVQTRQGTTLTIKLPFTITFDITRNTLTSANVGQITIYNLSKNNRAAIRKNACDTGDLRTVQLLAGYGNNLSIIFDGMITTAYSYRQGVDFLTVIESLDGGFAFANAKSSQQFPSNTENADVLQTLIGDLSAYGVSLGVVGSFPGQLTRGNSYSGQTCDILQELTGGRFFIDNGKAYALADNECVNGPVTTISPDTGLLETPIRQQTMIEVPILFEPKLVMAQQVTLQSLTADADINGNWKVVSIKHNGMISDAVCGDARTTAGLYQPIGSQALTIVGASA